MDNIDTLIFNDDTFQADMARIAVPYLSQRKDTAYTKNGLFTAYYEADNPRGLLVLSHGFSEGVYKYREFIYQLLLQGISVFAFEHRGHGRSVRPNSDKHTVYIDSFDTYLDDLLEISGEAQSKAGSLPMYLYGHSMGGCIAALFAERTSRFYEKVILSSPMIGIKMAEGAKAPLATLLAAVMCKAGKAEDRLPGSDEEETFDTSLTTGESRWDYFRKIRSENVLLQTDRASYGWARAAMKATKEVVSNTDSIKAPVLLIEAIDDTMVSVKAEEKFAALSDKVRLERLEGCRHEIVLSPKKVLEKYYTLIYSFLDLD